MRASRRRSCSRPSRSSISRARTSGAACSSPPIRTGANCACGPTSPFRCRATISPRPRPAGAAGFCYLARCFAIAPMGRPNSSRPASNSFGRRDTAAADAEMLALGLEATAHYGIAAPEIRMGDVGLFSALIAALDLAPAWKRRLIKDFNRKGSLAHDLDRLVSAAATSGRNIRACSRRSRAPIRRPRTRSSPTCSRSPASRRSADARSARSRTVSSNRRRSAQAPACRARRAR